jgi:hypothetical protein
MPEAARYLIGGPHLEPEYDERGGAEDDPERGPRQRLPRREPGELGLLWQSGRVIA